jgi:type I restriction enzyme M protein
MATGTNTVILFLRRRNNYDAVHISESVKNFFIHHKDNTIQGIESPIAKYISHVWQSLTLDDYISLISGEPTEGVKKHEIYSEYQKKIKAKNPKEWLELVRTTEQEKILYFLLAYGQKMVLVKSGEKKVEENFLGYKFSDAK